MVTSAHRFRGRDFAPTISQRLFFEKFDRGHAKLAKFDQRMLPLSHESVPEPTIYVDGKPASVLSISSELKLGEDAQSEKFSAVHWMTEFVSGLYGPFRTSKLITDEGGLKYLASDIRTILKKVGLVHPIAQLMAGAGLAMSRTAGDGAVYTIILGGKILERCRELMLKGLSISTILDGLIDALNQSLRVAEQLSIDASSQREKMLMLVMKTSVMNRLPENIRQKFASIIQKVVEIVGIDELTSIDVDKVVDIKAVESGTLEDSFVLDGVVVFKEMAHPGMPKRIENTRIAVIKDELRVSEKIGRYLDYSLELGDVGLKRLLEDKNAYISDLIKKITDFNVGFVVVEKGVDPIAIEQLAKAGIAMIYGLPHPEVELIVRAVNALPAKATLLEGSDLGWAGIVEEVDLDGKRAIFVHKCKKPKSVTILLRGVTNLLQSDVERCLKHSLPVFSLVRECCKVVYGGGAFEVELALRLREYADGIPDKRQLVVKAVAEAFEDVVAILSTNLGQDPIEILSNLRAEHASGKVDACINAGGGVAGAKELGLYELSAVKQQAIKTAFELAYTILRIDGIITGRKLSESEYYYVKRTKGTSPERLRGLRKEYGLETLE
ncbi:MAG: TCP-1/cpn60 chaperonin family protein [Aigarchaeota archaeon]|nr:TCP-1/cpn60 chaperonin family protein [Aigarchaeota archaeon]